MSVTRYNVGDKVVITEANIQIMENSNRSCVTPGYPSQSFIDEAKRFVGILGEVRITFPPGYEVTARFGDRSFHMKDHWITRAEEVK